MNFKNFIQDSFAVLLLMLGFLIIAFMTAELASVMAMADTRLPGDDPSSKMEAAATLLRFIDTGLFKWSARILAGLCIFSAGWNLKEMRFGPAVISLVAAILFGTAPTWVKNIFSIGGSDSVFAVVDPHSGDPKGLNRVTHA